MSNVIDLISSSPGERRPKSPSGSRPPALSKPRSLSPKIQYSHSKGLGGDSSSVSVPRRDQEGDVVVDLTDSVATHAPSPKRRRLCPPSELTWTLETIGNGLRKQCGSINPSFEADFPSSSSDVIPESRRGPAQLQSEGSRTQQHLARTASLAQPSSDPFASSPLPSLQGLNRHESPRQRPNMGVPLEHGVNLPKAQSQGVVLASSDPFRSSPVCVAASQKPAQVSTQGILSDPFTSSPMPPRRSPQKPPRRPEALSAARFSRQKRGEVESISSSAPLEVTTQPSPKSAPSKPGIINIDSDSSPAASSESDDLPELRNMDPNQLMRRRSPLRRSASETIPRKTQSHTKSALTVAERARAKVARNEEKERQKKEKQQQRLDAKATRAREKEQAAAVAEANKLRTDKRVSAPEMIVDLPSTMTDSMRVQVETILAELGISYEPWTSPLANVVKWRRKVKAKFNESLQLWEPTPLQIKPEPHAMLVITANDFVSLVQDSKLEEHVAGVKQHFPNCQVLYLLEGMTPWFRSNRNVRNRQFTSEVRAQDEDAQQRTTNGRRRRNQPAREYVPEGPIEDALLELQVFHDVLIHHTNVPLETAQWIAIFTQHISTIPYRQQRDKATQRAGFCMESGQVKTGEDAHDTYIKMMQEIVRITAPIAYGVAGEFRSVTELVNGLETGGHGRLEKVRKCANKDGVLSDRTIGPAVSKRLWKVFTGTDEDSTDV